MTEDPMETAIELAKRLVCTPGALTESLLREEFGALGFHDDAEIIEVMTVATEREEYRAGWIESRLEAAHFELSDAICWGEA